MSEALPLDKECATDLRNAVHQLTRALRIAQERGLCVSIVINPQHALLAYGLHRPDVLTAGDILEVKTIARYETTSL